MKGLAFLLRSIRGKILVSFFICIMIPITTILYSFYKSSGDVVQEEVQRGNREALHQVALNMNDLTERVLKASNLIINDPEFNQFLDSETDWNTSYESLRHYEIVQQRLINVRDILLDSGAVIAVIDNRGFVHTTLSGPNDRVKQSQMLERLAGEAWLKETRNHQGWPVWQYPYDGAIQKLAGADEPYFVLSRSLHGNQGEEADVLFIAIPSSVFLNVKAQLLQPEHSSYLVLDDNGHRLGGESPLTPEETDSLIGSLAQKTSAGQEHSEFSGKDYVIGSEQIPRLGWQVVQLVPQRQLWDQLGGIRNKSILWLIGWFLLFVLVFIYFMIRFTNPLRQLVRSMDRLGGGDFDSYVAIRGEDEFAVIGKNFNRMLDRLHQLILHLSEEQKRKEEARFQALQAQINPHFLFNTLNSIKWMAMLSGAQHVSQMITKLGKLLEYTMKVNHEVVPLETEMTHLESYLDLQKIRFHDNVSVQIEIPQPLRQSAILKFTLQPIVENSIIHGQRMPLSIDIRAFSEEDRLIIKVTDNGKGISEETLDGLRKQLSQNHARYSGIGIYNVNERIKMHFGASYGIQMESRAGEGTVVTVTLPLLNAAAEPAFAEVAEKERELE